MAEEPEPNFEDALTRVERIVEDLERGEPSLSAALAKYEDGVKLLRRCYDLLDQAERSVALLTGVDEQGQPTTAPFDAAATPAREPEAVAPAPAACRHRDSSPRAESTPRPAAAARDASDRSPTLPSDPAPPPGPSDLPRKMSCGGKLLKQSACRPRRPQTLHSTAESDGPGTDPPEQSYPKPPAILCLAKVFGGLVWTFADGMPTITSRSWSYGEEDLLRRSSRGGSGARRPAIGTRFRTMTTGTMTSSATRATEPAGLDEYLDRARRRVEEALTALSPGGGRRTRRRRARRGWRWRCGTACWAAGSGCGRCSA